MAAVRLMTQAEYAKHRGVSPQAVTKAVQAGRISLIDGRIDASVADIQWAKNTRARAVARPAGESAAVAAGAPGVAGAGALAPPAEDDYMASRTRREAAEAALAELRLAEQQGALIRADAVRSALAKHVSAVREALLQIPARLAPVLAAELDQGRCYAVLEAELVRALEQLLATVTVLPTPAAASVEAA